MVRRVLSALLSTKPMSEQRPFWPVMMLLIGNLISITFRNRYVPGSFPPTFHVPALMWFGLALEAVAVVLSVRYFAITLRTKQSRTKVI